MKESSDEPEALLDPIEARILGCLIEKQATTPETYPLTLNALVVACNQKTSREPVMKLDPGRVGQTLRRMEQKRLVRLVSGARADRWEHCADKTLELTPAQRVLIGLMLLRGPQTINELLNRSTRMHRFDDAEEVRYQLERLIGRKQVVLVPRQTGQREDRYMHLFGGPVQAGSRAASRPDEPGHDPPDDLAGRISKLEDRVAALERKLNSLE